MAHTYKLTDLFSSFYQMTQLVSTEEKARYYFEKMRWGDDPHCPYCGFDKRYTLTTKGQHKGMYKCANCKERYTVTIGTVAEGSKIPLSKWLIAIYLITGHKKGIASTTLSRDLDITQKSAWFMLHRIRHAVGVNEPKEQLSGTIQVDETFVGGKNRNRHPDKKSEAQYGRAFTDKAPVVGLLQMEESHIEVRPHKVIKEKIVAEKIITKNAFIRCRVTPNTKRQTLVPLLKENVRPGATIVTDEWRGYIGLKGLFNHQLVYHRFHQYVNEFGNSTNGIENYWNYIKRPYKGIYHHMPRKHLQRYVDEASFRFNTRHMSNIERMKYTIEKNFDGRITYKILIGK